MTKTIERIMELSGPFERPQVYRDYLAKQPSQKLRQMLTALETDERQPHTGTGHRCGRDRDAGRTT